ncbi:hypothetical protein C4K25_3758 [Pseudomonas chlororaphis]|nr:hypothetical protein C4K25_3758 [Pseudomonas chlororaphis]
MCPEGVRPDVLRWSLARRNRRPILEARHHTRDRARGMPRRAASLDRQQAWRLQRR